MICSNGIRDTNEQCDDGNTSNTDGCDVACKIEAEYFCKGQGNAISTESCFKPCGNGKRDLGEECDDGLLAGTSGDGCFMCKVETSKYCKNGDLATTDSCNNNLCGNNMQDPDEECDSPSGCTGCTVDVNYECTGGTPLTADVCNLIT